MSHRRSPPPNLGAEPLVSVVITSYNRPELLLHAIRSVRNQTYKPVEIIVIDDGSSVDIGQAVLAHDRHVAVIRNAETRGANYSRNAGIDRARGEIVAFLDDDDEWLPNKLEVQVAALREADACLCGYKVLETGKVRTHDITEVTGRHLRQGNPFCGASGFAARRYVFDRIRFDDALWIGQDWDIYVQIVREYSLRYTDTPLFLYRKGGQQSLSNQLYRDDSKFVASKLASLEKNRAFLGEFYYGVRVAGTYLRFIGTRGGRIRRILSAMGKAGVLPTLYYLYQKLAHRNGPRLSARRTAHLT
ncbi:MAG: glycosyltransferase [Rhodospirillales bacterium]|nr:glycosyltransferase [Rhodospirillales bacterium]